MGKVSKAKKDSLHSLIRSLTKSEKAYFKKFSNIYSKEKRTSYQELFDALEKTNVYDEKVLLKKLGQSPAAQNLFFHKNYLYNLILRCMNALYYNSTPENEFSEEMKSYRFLLNKSLRSEAKKILNKAQTVSKDYSQVLNTLDSLIAERRFFIEEYKSDMLQKIKGINSAIFSCMESMEKELKMSELYFESFPLMSRTGVARNEETINEIEEINKKVEQLSGTQGEETFNYKRWFNNFYETYFILKNDFSTSLKYSREIVKLYESHKKIKENNIMGYVFSINNLLNAAVRLHLFDEVENGILKLEEIALAYPSLSTRLKERSNHFKLVLMIEKGDKNPESIKLIEQWLYQNEKEISEAKKIILFYDLSVYFLFSGELKKALYYNNLVLNNFKDIIYKDFITESEILHLLIQYELGNFDYLQYDTLSVSRKLPKNIIQNKTEKTTIRYIKKLINSTTTNEKTAILLQFKKDLLNLKNDNFERFFISEVRLIQWVDKKLSMIEYSAQVEF